MANARIDETSRNAIRPNMPGRRARLEALIENAIAVLDDMDGDPDLENYNVDEEDSDPDYCVAGDDGMGPFILHGCLYWGSDYDV